ncbi:hypothetical protein JCM10450v2_002978 [Rhodotorula kratochvilovae]
MAAPAPSGSGFKLKLTLGGASGPATAAPAAPPAHAPAPQPPHPHLAPPFYHPHPAPAPATYPDPAAHFAHHHPQAQLVQGGDDGEERVSAAKYRKLKKLYLAAVESRDDAQLALHRAQKLVVRLRDDKSSLLDRVLELELAAGLTSADVGALREETRRAERELAFPLLHQPALPSLADRPQKPPTLTTATELTNDKYNAPTGPAPLPKTFPPRQRSHHLRTAVAAQKLRDEYDAQRIAHGLPRPAFPAVAALGLEGSSIAINVERALAGEALEPAAEPTARGSKRRRESSSGAGARGKSRASAAAASAPVAEGPPVPMFNNLPNPFAAAGAVPLGAQMARNNAEAFAAAATATAASESPVVEQSISVAATPADEADFAMDDAASVGSDGGFVEDDGGDYKPPAVTSGRARGGARKSDYGAAGDKLVKPKKVKQHGLTSGTFSIPPIPRNADGSIRLPMSVGIMQIKSLGAVDVRDGFHTERYIFPVGFEATRRYPSMVDRTGSAEYICRITDGGDGNPRFELHPSDQPGVVIMSGTPTGAWTQVVKATNKLRERNHSNSVSGPDYYGLSHNIVKAMIQELPHADQVPGYIWQNFVEDASQRAPAGTGKKATAAAGKRKSRAHDGYEMSPPAGEIAVDDGTGLGGYGLDTGYDNGDGGSPVDYAHHDPSAYAVGDYQVHQPTSLQHLLAGAPAPNPYDIPTSMPAAVVPGAAGAIDPMFNMAAAPQFDPYTLQGAQAMIDPAFGDAGAYAYPMQPGGQPVEYPSSEAESD